jgi:aspartate/methionine/tyrosine aminotransferase
VNPDLAKLQPYPFERLRLLFKDITPDPRYSAINLGIGEPKHPPPEFIRRALTASPYYVNALPEQGFAVDNASVPEGGFCFWSETPTDDEHFASALYREYNVTVLPGRYLARASAQLQAKLIGSGLSGLGEERSSCLR